MKNLGTKGTQIAFFTSERKKQMQGYELGFSKKAMLVLILPREVDASDAASVLRAIDQIGEDRFFLTGGSERRKEAKSCDGH